MKENVKIWTTLPKSVHDEVIKIGADFGYADAELFRELIRRGLSDFKQLNELRLSPREPQEVGAILKVANQVGESINLQELPKRFKKSW